MYKKSLTEDNTDYVKGIESFISKSMTSDKKAYVNQRILNRLKNGITSGKNGQTGWSRADLKLSIGSATFSWKLKNYDSKKEKAVVEVHITDDFDFNKGGAGVRSNDGEKLEVHRAAVLLLKMEAVLETILELHRVQVRHRQEIQETAVQLELADLLVQAAEAAHHQARKAMMTGKKFFLLHKAKTRFQGIFIPIEKMKTQR